MAHILNVTKDPRALAFLVQEKIFKVLFLPYMGVQSWSCFVCFNSLPPSQQFFSHVGKDLPGLNQYQAAYIVLLKDTTQ